MLIQNPQLRAFTLLRYSTWKNANDEGKKTSTALREAIKGDGALPDNVEPWWLSDPARPQKAIDAGAYWIKAELTGGDGKYNFLGHCFGPEVLLVPMPGHDPGGVTGRVSIPERICESLVAQGLGAEVIPLIERIQKVPKSAFHTTGADRPTHLTHQESTRVHAAFVPKAAHYTRITLVDDFLTRGATFYGVFPHVRRAFPEAKIECFAMVRTESFSDVISHFHPVVSRIFVSAQGKPCCYANED